MPSWNTLDTEVLEKWEKALNTKRDATLEEQLQEITHYYQYLIRNRHDYGNLAYQVIQDIGFEGKLANRYLQHLAQKGSIEFTAEKRQALMLNLALADVAARKGNAGHAIPLKDIEKYHIKIFKDKAGLPEAAWAGTLFEKHMGTGTWRFGQGPTDQNGGLFNWQHLNQFFRKASDTGTEAHRDFAKASMVFYTEGVLHAAILESPLEFLKYMVNTIQNLQSTDEGLAYNPFMKLCAQVLLRDKWNSCFRAIEANDWNIAYQLPKTMEEILQLTNKVMSGMYAGDPAMDVMVKMPEYQCNQAKAFSQFFAQKSGINPGVEAQLAYDEGVGADDDKPLYNACEAENQEIRRRHQELCMLWSTPCDFNGWEPPSWQLHDCSDYTQTLLAAARGCLPCKDLIAEAKMGFTQSMPTEESTVSITPVQTALHSQQTSPFFFAQQWPQMPAFGFRYLGMGV